MTDQILSPLNPPDAYAPPRAEKIDPEQMHPFLKALIADHASLLEEIKAFEVAILSIQKNGPTKDADRAVRKFFTCFDQEFVTHSRREEARFFPLLHDRLILSGEHSIGASPTTAVDLMMDDHLKAVQLAAVVLNFMGLGFRLPDEKSRLIVLDAALEQAKNLVELMRLHIFREDNVLFSLAHQLINADEFERITAPAAPAT